MEVLGVFLFAQLFNPLPWHFHVLLAAYNGIGGAIDHSAFYIPGTIIDGRCVLFFGVWGLVGMGRDERQTRRPARPVDIN